LEFGETHFGCQPDCAFTFYDITWFSSHLNKYSIIDPLRIKDDPTNLMIGIAFEYKDTFTKLEIENLFYDDSNMLATVGGFLGIALGFSCLDFLIIILRWIETRVLRKRHRKL